MADEIEALFYQFDKDKSRSFDYEEFLQVCLILKEQQKERCLRYEVNNIYSDLADGYIHEIWFLDLLLKIKSSTDIVPLLDITNPLQNAFINKNLKMISFLIGANYPERSEQNRKEWELAIANAVVSATKGDYENQEINSKCALALCENKGVPIVVQLIKGDNLIPMDDDGNSDPYVTVDVEGIQKASIVRNETLNPVWNENLLFIIDFKRAKYLLGLTDVYKSKSQININQNSDDPINIANLVYTKQLPQYAINAITRMHPELASNIESTDNFGGNPKSTEHEETKYENNPSRKPQKLEKSIQDLQIIFRVFDKDVDSEDDFMGSYRAKISLRDIENPIENFHEKIHTAKLQYKDPYTNKLKDAGTISFKIFLNIAYIYQHYGISYIDDDNNESNDIIEEESIDDVDDEEIVTPKQYK